MYWQVKRQLSMRTRFLLSDRDVPLRERLRIVTATRAGRRAMRYLVENRLRRDPPDPHFSIAELTFGFEPPYPIADRRELLRGISQVLVESFIFPEFFSGPVRLRSGDVVLDLGANIGTTAVLFSKCVGPDGRVFAFEPVVSELCRRNIARNQATNVTVVPCGVAERAGMVDFRTSDFCLDSHACDPEPRSGARPSQTCRARMIRLDEWVGEQRLERVDFIKMDIEGAEEAAIRGAENLIARFRPRWSISSYHVDPSGEPQHPKLVRLLKSFGYRVQERGRIRIFAW
jgi:FkbM family methyltransferase